MFGKLGHNYEPTPIDKQGIVPMNRDRLLSWVRFDLTAPATIIKPDSGNRFQSMFVVNQDHYIKLIAYDPGEFVLTKEKMGTRYVQVMFRTLADSANPEDVKAANALQNKIIVHQSSPGEFDIPPWDETSRKKVREGLQLMGSTLQGIAGMFGDVGEVDPITHMIGPAGGYGGTSDKDAIYLNSFPEKNDGKTAYMLKVKDILDGSWKFPEAQPVK